MITLVPPTIAPDDVASLVDSVAELERTQRTEDVEGFLALFAPEAVWVNGAGRRLIGLAEIAAFTREVLPGAMATGSVNYSVQHIQLLAPDLALTGVRQEYVDLDGRPLTPPAMGSPTYLWARRATGWSLVAGQNTTYSA